MKKVYESVSTWKKVKIKYLINYKTSLWAANRMVVIYALVWYEG